MAVQNDRIPKEFTGLTDRPVAKDVGELIEELKRLPKEVSLGSPRGVRIAVLNNHDAADTEPFVSFTSLP